MQPRTPDLDGCRGASGPFPFVRDASCPAIVNPFCITDPTHLRDGTLHPNDGFDAFDRLLCGNGNGFCGSVAAARLRRPKGRIRSATVNPGGHRPGRWDYTSVRSAISSASSTSMPRYLTVLSSLL
jgi:hypothetical protein